MTQGSGKVYLVGAGPGDPGMITVQGLALLRRADVVAYDRLIARELLSQAREGAEIVNVGKARGHHNTTQAMIDTLLVDRAQKGLMVVRLKGGDPFVFGRGYEELTVCRNAGIDCVVVPGVSSAFAGPAAAGIPLTERRCVRSFAVITAMTATECGAAPLSYDALAQIDSVVIMMGRGNLRELSHGLIAAGRDPTTPAACVERATTPRQRVTLATLETIADAADRDALKPPVVTVVGEAARHAVDGGFGKVGPLTGLRIVVTRPARCSTALTTAFSVAGAALVHCPMTKTVPVSDPRTLDSAIDRLRAYDWIVFANVHSVIGFWERLSARALDTRTIGACRVAAIGRATARAIERRGITADATSMRSETELVIPIDGDTIGAHASVLWVHGDVDDAALIEALGRSGAQVDEVSSYTTVAANPPPSAIEMLRAGVDGIVFCSPACVRRFRELDLSPGSATVACIDEATANAARDAHLEVHLVPRRPTYNAVVEDLSRHFASADAVARGRQS